MPLIIDPAFANVANICKLAVNEPPSLARSWGSRQGRRMCNLCDARRLPGIQCVGANSTGIAIADTWFVLQDCEVCYNPASF